MPGVAGGMAARPLLALGLPQDGQPSDQLIRLGGGQPGQPGERRLAVSGLVPAAVRTAVAACREAGCRV